MKKKNHMKPTMINRSDSDVVFNNFPYLVMLCVQITMLALLQGEFNLVSILLLFIDGVVLSVISYQIGKEDGGKHD